MQLNLKCWDMYAMHKLLGDYTASTQKIKGNRERVGTERALGA